MEIKMIVTDLDGTLLRSDKTISEYTASVLMRCQHRGIKTVYATARGSSAERILSNQLFDGRIIMNGALGYIHEKPVYNRLIPYNIARPVLMACSERGLKTASEFSGRHYSNFKVSDVWTHIDYYEIVDFSTHAQVAEKLYMVITDSDDIDFIRTHLPETLYLTVSRDNLAMVMHREATKSRAIAALAKEFQIGQDEIAVFGDDLNDIDMLEYAGISIAMSNAIHEVKAAADNITASNDEDGVARWLEENVLI